MVMVLVAVVVVMVMVMMIYGSMRKGTNLITRHSFLFLMLITAWLLR